MPCAKRINPCGFILRHLIGGFALAARWAGIQTVQFVEIDKFCQKVLAKNFPGVPIHDDIKTFTNCKSYGLEERGMAQHRNKRGQSSRNNDNVATFTESGKSGEPSEQEGRENISRRNQERHFLLTGGFPCQPFSCAGKRRGKEDDRYLWEEMLRVIKEFKPTWIIGENVNGIRSMEFQDGVSELEGDTVIQEDGDNGYTNVLDGICNSLEALDYEVQPIIIPACAVNAPHRRDRVWIVARYVEDTFCGGDRGRGDGDKAGGKRTLQIERPDSHAADTTSRQRLPRHENEPFSSSGEARQERCRCVVDVTDSGNEGLQGSEETGNIGINRQKSRNEQFRGLSCWQEPWLEVATRLCRVDDGLPRKLDRVHRLKALGNAIVPQVAHEIMKSILEFA
jgi:DNA (cytosine-5)-methyltransferase 1